MRKCLYKTVKSSFFLSTEKNEKILTQISKTTLLFCSFVLMFYDRFALANSVDIDEMSHNTLSGSCDSSLYAKVLTHLISTMKTLV